MVVTMVSRNANEAMVAPMVGVFEYAFGGSMESGGRYMLVRLAQIWLYSP
jgi:hypothetical protein